MTDGAFHSELNELILAQLDGAITPEQYVTLERLLNEDAGARRYYTEYIMLCASLKRHVKSLPAADPERKNEDLFNTQLWQDLANEEKTAKVVKLESPKADSPSSAIKKSAQERLAPGIRKRSLITFATSMAALIFLILLARYYPTETGAEVATLTDSIGARWEILPGTNGARLTTSYTPFILHEGLIEVHFDNTAKVVIEAPARFYLLTEDQMKLDYGKLYAVVPQPAIGFSVTTRNSRIIDLGTEFGVQVGKDGSTELHVIEGKINLLAGITNKMAMGVFQGNAKRVSGSTSQVNDIPVKETEFVRSIDSTNDTIWRGQKEICLADMVGGGNGLGEGKTDLGIDPISGKLTAETWGRRQSANTYHRVPASPYIDGVFIPNGKTQQVISSEGHLFLECPVTSGLCCDSLIHVQMRPDSLFEQPLQDSDQSVPVLLIHANMGITFDLDAIRSLLPGTQIVRFQSKYGIRKWSARPSVSNADFWFLVDGKLKYSKTQIKTNSVFDVAIDLSENDRFLTLIETDGGDPEGRVMEDLVLPPIDSDWGVFMNPTLVLE